ncbi:hypothetical protein LSH36_635g01017 [Paralvinella palmiformis]|uniref:Uncharacterized protein n=1 Tax=Paralvinella palmiformis TaxID=53620 RepID=A0AAD9J4N6_9ANNE|nr:hypothetical protein LSH36_635g01017 [Paralvinella palmiformis]
MSAFCGKWKRISATNVDEFIKATDLADEKAAKVRSFLKEANIVEEFVVTEKGTRRKIYVDGILHQDVTSNFNEPQEAMTALGKSTLVAKKVSNNKIEYMETAPGRADAFSVLMVEGNKLLLDYTLNGVTCRRTYERQ